jgi:integrase
MALLTIAKTRYRRSPCALRAEKGRPHNKPLTGLALPHYVTSATPVLSRGGFVFFRIPQVSTMPKTNRFNFNNRAILALPAHDPNSPSRSAEYSDTSVIGLKAVVGKTGNKSFSFRYQLPGGRKRCLRVGTFPAIDVPEARKIALEWRAVVDRGGDPMEQHDRQKAMPTFAEFVTNEYMPYAMLAKRSARDDASKFKVHLLPKFGDRRLCDIGRRDVEGHHVAMRQSHSAASANRHLALLSAVFVKAVEYGRLERNPAAGLKAFREDNQRQRFLSADEIGRIYAAMATEPNQTAVAALKLLLLTGTRREESLQARWENVDLNSGQWWLPTTKSGRSRYVTLNADAKALLASLPSRGVSPWVFPGRDGDKPLNNPLKAFNRILAAAKITEHVRIHDLRHSFASLAVSAGASLYEVQNLLGQSSPAMAQRYSHLADSSLRRASQAVADVVSAAVRSNVESRAAA